MKKMIAATWIIDADDLAQATGFQQIVLDRW